MGKPLIERLRIAEQRIVDLYKKVTVSGGGTTNPTNPSFTTTEVATGGTWIDGKPIYRKVIAFTVPSFLEAPTAVDIIHNLNIDKYIRLDVVTNRSVDLVGTEDQLFTFPLLKGALQTSLNTSGVVQADRNAIRFEEVKSSITTNDFLLILEYIKV